MVNSCGNIVEYEVYVQSKLIKWLRLETNQVDYVKAVTLEIWKVINEQHQSQSSLKTLQNRKSKAGVKYAYHLAHFDKI